MVNLEEKIAFTYSSQSPKLASGTAIDPRGWGKNAKKTLNFLADEFRNLRVKAYPAVTTIDSFLISAAFALAGMCGPAGGKSLQRTQMNTELTTVD
jgi:hypothetical protein